MQRSPNFHHARATGRAQTSPPEVRMWYRRGSYQAPQLDPEQLLQLQRQAGLQLHPNNKPRGRAKRTEDAEDQLQFDRNVRRLIDMGAGRPAESIEEAGLTPATKAGAKPPPPKLPTAAATPAKAATPRPRFFKPPPHLPPPAIAAATPAAAPSAGSAATAEAPAPTATAQLAATTATAALSITGQEPCNAHGCIYCMPDEYCEQCAENHCLGYDLRAGACFYEPPSSASTAATTAAATTTATDTAVLQAAE